MDRRQVLVSLATAAPLLGYSEMQPRPTQIIHRVSATAKVNAPLQPLSRQSCRLNCAILVETDDEALLEVNSRRPHGAADPVQVRCARETPMFAADMERKSLKGLYTT